MEHSLGSALKFLFFMIVLDQCQDRYKCKLLASTTAFGQDPCPETSKYLEVAYKCRPNEFRSRAVCEENELRLHCSKSERLAIYSSTFGWSQSSSWSTQCSGYSPYNLDCDSPCAYSHVYSRCHGKKRCSIEATDRHFQSNCEASSAKYLVVIYTCVQKRILKDIDEDAEYPNPCVSATEAPEETPTPSTDHEDDYHDYDYAHWELGPNQSEPGAEGGDAGNEEDTGLETDLNGQASFLPNPSTVNYNQGLTPRPESDHRGDADEFDIPVYEYDQNSHPGAGSTGKPDTSAVHEGVAGFVSDWIFTWNFIKENTEKFILYISLGVSMGIILVLLVVIIRLNQLRRRGVREAKLNITEPIANSGAAQQGAAETTSLLEQSDQSDGGVEMTSYNQIGSLHRPPVSSFTDPYEEETPVSFPGNNEAPPHPVYNPNQETFIGGLSSPNTHQAPVVYKNLNHTSGGNAVANSSLTKPNHSRQTSFTGSLGRNSQPGMLTGSLNRRDHWTNEYRNEGHGHTLQHYYG